MTVAELLDELAAAGLSCESRLPAATAIGGISHDSRQIGPGDLFVALPGIRSDGMEFSGQALERGAVAVLGSMQAGGRDGSLPIILVDDVAVAAGVAAAALHGKPSERMQLVGVTGTNGKTSVTYILESIWQAAGIKAGVLGTIETRCPDFERPAPMTTLPAVELQALLAEIADSGCTWAALEVSSHGLAQKRVAGCSFAAAVFTNLSRDHLDYHEDEESYFAAKRSLFTAYLVRGGAAVINADDARAGQLLRAVGAADPWTYSTAGADARVVVRECRQSLAGTSARIDVDGEVLEFESGLVGEVNLSNTLAAAAAARATGVGIGDIARGLESCRPVPGRLERIGTSEPPVIVDYAHTPDALDRTLASLRAATNGRLILVFGCGGDRDRGKRSEMGAIADAMSDVAVLTSDNPRGEDAAAIIMDIQAGLACKTRLAAAELAGADKAGYMVEPDRRRAIAAALDLAAPGDLVVVAGKGHEDYQELAAGRRIPFDDRAIIRELVGAV